MSKHRSVFCSLALMAGLFALASNAALADALSPKETYLKYRATLSKAKDVKDISSFLSKHSVDMINQTPEEDKPMMFGIMKDTSPNVVQVLSEEIKGNIASLKMTGSEPGLDPKIKEKTEGTVTFVKENGEWKIDKENWNSKITRTD